MQLNPLNSNHVSQLQHSAPQEVVHNSSIKALQEKVDESIAAEKSRLAKVFSSLTQEMTTKERMDRGAILEQTFQEDFQEGDLDFSMLQIPQAKSNEISEEDAPIVASLSTPVELKGFINEFYTLYNSGYTPVDLKI